MPFALVTSATDILNGADAYAGIGQVYAFTFSSSSGGVWAVNDTYTVNLTDPLTAQSVSLGAGTVTGLQPSFVFTYNDKINLLAGTAWYFSDVGQPTVFNDPRGLGNSFIELANSFGTPEDLTAIATYQGRLIITSRRNTQIWSVDPTPENYQKGQILQNIGTMAPRSVQAVGDMDVYMLADNGIRSVRVRDASNNAIIADVGTPIDEIIQGLLETLTETQKAASCGVVEPSSNRYWLYLPGDHIYVLSYFPTSGIQAWTRYRPTTAVNVSLVPTTPTGSNVWTVEVGELYYWTKGTGETTMTCGTTVLTASGYFVASSTTATALHPVIGPGLDVGTMQQKWDTFAPTQFAVQNGRVYARAGDALYLYGGTDNQSYDYCLPQYDMPFLNAKSPATRKTYHGLDHIAEGTWTVSLGTNVADGEDLTEILILTGPSVMRGKALAAKQGTHFKLRGVEKSSVYARFSMAILHFDGGDQK